MNLKQIQEDIAQGEGLHRDKVVLDNPCTLHHFGEITPQNLRPYSENPTICKFMIQLGRFDQLGSGVTNINKYLPYYAKGAKPIFNETRHGFELTIPLAEEVTEQAAEQVTEQVTGEETGEVTGEVIAFLKALRATPLGRKEAQNSLGLKGQANFRERYLEPALTGEFVEMTQPDSPKSPTQKYRLTAKGKHLLEGGK